MVNDAEKYKAQDEEYKLKLESKNSFENMLFQMKSTIETTPLDDKDNVMNKINENIEWLSSHHDEDVSVYKDKYVKLIVVNKKDLYQFDKFTDRLLQADAFEVKIIEDFSELDADNVSDDIVNNTEDTMTLLEKYIDQLDVTLSKDRLKNTMRSLYTEAQDLEI
jgi:hypothetical protein